MNWRLKRAMHLGCGELGISPSWQQFNFKQTPAWHQTAIDPGPMTMTSLHLKKFEAISGMALRQFSFCFPVHVTVCFFCFICLEWIDFCNFHVETEVKNKIRANLNILIALRSSFGIWKSRTFGEQIFRPEICKSCPHKQKNKNFRHKINHF